MQAVLVTIQGGENVSHQPARERVIGTFEDTEYIRALELSRQYRLSAYQRDDVVRVVNENQLAGCAHREGDLDGYGLFQWLHHADLLETISYAIVVDVNDLHMYVRQPA